MSDAAKPLMLKRPNSIRPPCRRSTALATYKEHCGGSRRAAEKVLPPFLQSCPSNHRRADRCHSRLRVRSGERCLSGPHLGGHLGKVADGARRQRSCSGSAMPRTCPGRQSCAAVAKGANPPSPCCELRAPGDLSDRATHPVHRTETNEGGTGELLTLIVQVPSRPRQQLVRAAWVQIIVHFEV